MVAPTGNDALLLTRDGPVATLWLNRPDAGNALDLPMASRFGELMAELRDDAGLRVLVLAGTGRLFCAGGDVRAMDAAPDDAARGRLVGQLADTMHQGLLIMRQLPVPVIAAVHGPVAGGGIGLVLSADLAVAAESARFSAAYPRIGLAPDCGMSALLPRAVGPRRAAVFALTDLTLDAVTAAEWGLITETCPDAELPGRVAALARQLAERPAGAIGQTARLARLGWERPLAEQLADEATAIAGTAADPGTGRLIAGFVAARGSR